MLLWIKAPEVVGAVADNSASPDNEREAMHKEVGKHLLGNGKQIYSAKVCKPPLDEGFMNLQSQKPYGVSNC